MSRRRCHNHERLKANGVTQCPTCMASLRGQLPKSERSVCSAGAHGYAAPVNILKAIIEEARNRHADILTEESWNPDYTLEISLKVSELRELAGWLQQHNIPSSATGGCK